MLLKFFDWISFRLALLFFLNWHKFIPRHLDYCRHSGYFYFTQSIALNLLRITQYWPERLSAEFTRRRLLYLLKKTGAPAPIESKDENFTSYFSKLPILTREQLRINSLKAIDKYNLAFGETLLSGTTSGSSGIPMLVGFTKRFALQFRIMRRRLFEFAGLKTNDNFIGPRSKLTPHFCKNDLFIKPDLRSLIDSSHEFLKIISSKQIKAIYAFPTFYTLFCEKILKEKLEIPALKALIIAGENLLPETREFIENTLKAKLFNFYASVEMGAAIAQECEFHDGLHINQEFYFIEILTSEGTPADPNTLGRIVITFLDLGIVPIIRYDTGDVGMLLAQPCRCGRSLQRLHLLGRTPEVIETAGGTISQHAFKEILDGYDPRYEKIKRFQILIEDNKLLTLLIIPSEKFTSEDLRRIEETCRKFLRNMIEFNVRATDSLEYLGLKAPFLIRKNTKAKF